MTHVTHTTIAAIEAEQPELIAKVRQYVRLQEALRLGTYGRGD